MRVVLMGPPGAGKGTQADILARRFNVSHLAPGNIFRYHVAHQTFFGKKIQTYMDRNEFVPDSVTNAMMIDRLDQCADGFILDGYPRTLQQAQVFQQYLSDRDLLFIIVAVFDVSADVLLKRIGHRRVCRDCGMVYHNIHAPPTVPGQCDACQGNLIQRPDDQPEAFAKRLVDYHRQTAPVIGAMERAGFPVVHIDGEKRIFEVTKELLASVERMKTTVGT